MGRRHSEAVLFLCRPIVVAGNLSFLIFNSCCQRAREVIMAMANSPQWPLSVPCLASGGVTVLNNPLWPINFNSRLPESIEEKKEKKESCTSSRPSGRGQKRQILGTVKSCWPVNNGGLHTPSRTTVVFLKLPLGPDGEGRNTTALGLKVVQSEIVFHRHSPSSRRARCQRAQSCSKSNSMFVCRHVVSE